MTTGLFFGSFNPIHYGHLAIAHYIVDFTEVDELWFVVSPQNPLKDKEILAPDIHRLEMVKLAIHENENRMMVCDIELSMPKPSYTIDTLHALGKKYPENEFILIFGSDSLDTITKWKDYQKIINDYKIFIYPREGSNIKELSTSYPVKIVNAPLVDYSSTSIREKISRGEDVRRYMPEEVYNYIFENKIYQTNL